MTSEKVSVSENLFVYISLKEIYNVIKYLDRRK